MRIMAIVALVAGGLALAQSVPVPGGNMGASPGPAVYSMAKCNSSYAVYLGSVAQRRSVEISTAYDATPIYVGPFNVTTCPGCPFSAGDAGFSDAGPGVVGELVQPGAYLSKDLSTLGQGLWCLKAAGAQDGTFDGGWTTVVELP